MSQTQNNPSGSTQSAPAMPKPMTMDEMVDKFVRLRNKVAELKKEQADALNPYSLAMGALEARILDGLNNMGADSVKTPHGTAYKTTRTSTKVMDWTATLEFIKSREAWDLLEARVSKNAAAAIMEEIRGPIPGVSTSSTIEIGVRKS
jgi:nucleotidyltransferase/DNA polymerase involved in DNA repair